jgi:hypothetical protein
MCALSRTHPISRGILTRNHLSHPHLPLPPHPLYHLPLFFPPSLSPELSHASTSSSAAHGALGSPFPAFLCLHPRAPPRPHPPLLCKESDQETAHVLISSTTSMVVGPSSTSCRHGCRRAHFPLCRFHVLLRRNPSPMMQPRWTTSPWQGSPAHCSPAPASPSLLTRRQWRTTFFWYFPELPMAHTHGAPPVSYMWRAGLVRHRYVYIHLAH